MGLGKTVRSIGLVYFLILTYTASMHRVDVDATQTVFGSWENYNPEVCHRMSLEFGRQLGQ